jgi:hypothetical protein
MDAPAAPQRVSLPIAVAASEPRFRRLLEAARRALPAVDFGTLPEERRA